MTTTTEKPLGVRGLLPHHAEQLRASTISEETTRSRGYFSVTTREEMQSLGFKDYQSRGLPALAFPIYRVDGTIAFYQARPDAPRSTKEGKVRKYENPTGVRMVLDVSPTVRPKLGNPNIPLWVTEGIKKSDSAVSHGLDCIALLSVTCWRGTNGEGGKTALACWDSIALNGRRVYVCFDSDVMQKAEVHHALGGLKRFLESRKAEVCLVYLPSGPDGEKIGLDDYFAAGGTTEDLIKLAVPELRPFATGFHSNWQGGAESTASSEAESTPWFDDEEFLPEPLARELMKRERFIASPIDRSGQGMILRIYRGGVYCADGEQIARSLAADILKREAKPTRLNDTMSILKELTKLPESALNDKALDLINVENGLLNWRTGKLDPHTPDYFSTIQIPVPWVPDAESEVLDRYVATTLPADALALHYELIGYLLRPDTRQQKGFLFTGEGENGKSIDLEMIEALLGEENTTHLALHELEESRFKTAQLHGKLVCLFADLDARALKSVSAFKMLTSGDPIQGEHKFQHPFDFKPFARLLFSANEIPRSPDRSHAFMRRLVVVPFPNKFDGSTPERTPDKNLGEKLKSREVLTALLRHAVEGLRRLEKQGGFTPCASAEAAKADYRRKNDSAVEFISEHLEGAEKDFWLGRQEVYEKYLAYCEKNKLGAAKQREWNQRLAEILSVCEFVATEKVTTPTGTENKRVRAWGGLAWKEEAP